MPIAKTPRAALAGALAAGLLAAGCGSGGTIPPSRSAAIRAHLDDVSAAVRAGDCSVAAQRAQRVRSDIENLRDVPARLRRNLLDGADKLATAAQRDCQDAQQPVTTPETTPTETTPPPETTTTETTPPPTTTTQTETTPPPTSTTPPPTTTSPSTGGASPGESGGTGTTGGSGGTGGGGTGG